MPTIDPTEARRRSFVYRRLLAAGARFEILGDGTVATNFPEVRTDAIERLAICDLSGLPRIGIKGRDTLDWLRGLGFDFDEVEDIREQEIFASIEGRWNHLFTEELNQDFIFLQSLKTELSPEIILMPHKSNLKLLELLKLEESGLI